MRKLKQRRVSWKPSYRIVPNRYPTVTLFDRVADPADFDALYALEALTNDRLRDELGEVSLVPPAERITGPGTTPIMAAFTHLNPQGSRFSDGSFGIYYAARKLDTAIAETRYHRERFLRATNESPIDLEMRTYLADIKGKLTDIRQRRDLRSLYDPDSYAASQPFGKRQRETGVDGIVYDSVRHGGGQCVATFRPKVIAPCVQGPHLIYAWDGTRIREVYEKKFYFPKNPTHAAINDH
jgi:RES domain